MDNFNAYFYTLVSLDTKEMKFADHRQQYLVDQGFYYEIIEQMPFMKSQKEKKKLIMNDNASQQEFLDQILKNKDSKEMRIEEKIEKDED